LFDTRYKLQQFFNDDTGSVPSILKIEILGNVFRQYIIIVKKRLANLFLFKFYCIFSSTVSFGVKAKSDIDFLKGKVDIAVVGSETIKIMNEKGISAVADFISNLRS